MPPTLGMTRSLVVESEERLLTPRRTTESQTFRQIISKPIAQNINKYLDEESKERLYQATNPQKEKSCLQGKACCVIL